MRRAITTTPGVWHVTAVTETGRVWHSAEPWPSQEEASAHAERIRASLPGYARHWVYRTTSTKTTKHGVNR